MKTRKPRVDRYILKKENAIRVDTIVQVRSKEKSDSTYISKRYVFNCSECKKEFSTRSERLKNHSGKCKACCKHGRPYFHIYSRLISQDKRRNLSGTMTYEDYLEFTEKKNCYYCLCVIPWRPYCYENGKYASAGYYLDRIENNLGYLKENCVQCCTRCNYGRSDRYTSEEWFEMNKYFRDKV